VPIVDRANVPVNGQVASAAAQLEHDEAVQVRLPGAVETPDDHMAESGRRRI
jgi:hypothetical protein